MSELLYAYPNGAFTDRDKKLVKRAGYHYAFSVVPRKHTRVTSLFMQYEIPRMNLTDDTYRMV